MSSTPSPAGPRYVALVKVGSGAYATVHVALDRGPLGVRQLVALKILHPHLADEPAQRDALVREARLLSAVRHPNVVELRDVDVDAGVRLVLGYVEGVTLGRWLVEAGQRRERLAPAIVARIARDAAAGLHAIHEATSETGKPLGLVHRDVSPQNLLVGVDGVTRLSDFGTAKILFEPASETTEGSLKGKLGYMAPEYIRGAPVDLRIDVFALGVVVWEAFTGKRLFRGGNEGETLDRILSGDIPPASSIDASLAPFDEVLARALSRDPAERTKSALAFGRAVEDAARRAGLDADHAAVGDAMAAVFEPTLRERRESVARAIEALAIEAQAEDRAAVSAAPEATGDEPSGRPSRDAPSTGTTEASGRWARRGVVAMIVVAAVALALVGARSWRAETRSTTGDREGATSGDPGASAPSAPPLDAREAPDAPVPTSTPSLGGATSSAPSSSAPSSSADAEGASAPLRPTAGALRPPPKPAHDRTKPPPNPY